ncbi:hypothetical protein HK104_003965 [Borealophlyctis nickersoniae]|nr:hypothetical protein HK104_003965 [Borealophlyctis nickersoniae]
MPDTAALIANCRRLLTSLETDEARAAVHDCDVWLEEQDSRDRLAPLASHRAPDLLHTTLPAVPPEDPKETHAACSLINTSPLRPTAFQSFPSFQTSPQEIIQQVLNTLRSRFDYVRTALTCRAAFAAASDKALLRSWFIRYMRNEYFTLYDGHPKLEYKCGTEVMDAAGAEALGYSFRNVMRLLDICGDELDEHSHDAYQDADSVPPKEFLPFAISLLELAVMLQDDLETYKKLPVSDRRFVQQFLSRRTAHKSHAAAVTTLFSAEWYTDGYMFWTFDAVVRQPMGDFDVGDRLCLVVEQPYGSEPHYEGRKYMALDTFGRVFHGAVRWKVHLPGGSTLIDDDDFGDVFKDTSWHLTFHELKWDLGPEFRQGDAVRIYFRVNEDLSADLTIRKLLGFRGYEYLFGDATPWLKVTFHSIVWTPVRGH